MATSGSSKVDILFNAKGLDKIIGEIEGLQSKTKGIGDNVIGESLTGRLETILAELQQIKATADVALNGMGTGINTEAFDRLSKDVSVIAAEIGKLTTAFETLGTSGKFADNLAAGFERLDGLLTPIEAKMKAISEVMSPVQKLLKTKGDQVQKYQDRLTTLQKAQANLAYMSTDDDKLMKGMSKTGYTVFAKELETTTVRAEELYNQLIKNQQAIQNAAPNSAGKTAALKEQIALLEEFAAVSKQVETLYGRTISKIASQKKIGQFEAIDYLDKKYSGLSEKVDPYLSGGSRNSEINKILTTRMQTTQQALTNAQRAQTVVAKQAIESTNKAMADVTHFAVKNGAIQIPIKVGLQAAENELVSAIELLQTRAKSSPIMVPIEVTTMLAKSEGSGGQTAIVQQATQQAEAIAKETTTFDQLRAKMVELGQAITGVPQAKLDLSGIKISKATVSNIESLAVALGQLGPAINQLNAKRINSLSTFFGNIKDNKDVVNAIKALDKASKSDIKKAVGSSKTGGVATTITEDYKKAQSVIKSMSSKVAKISPDYSKVATGLMAELNTAFGALDKSSPFKNQTEAVAAYESALKTLEAELAKVATLQKELGATSKLDRTSRGFDVTSKLPAFVGELDAAKVKVAELKALIQEAFNLNPKNANYATQLDSMLARIDVLKKETQAMFRGLQSPKWGTQGVWQTFMPNTDQYMEKIRKDVQANNGKVTNWGDASSNIHKISYEYTDLAGNINKVTMAADQARGSITRSVNVVPQISSMEKALTTIGTKIKQVSAYWLAFYANPMMAIHYFKNIIGYVKELDSALTELRVVSNASGGELASIATQAYEVAQKNGRTTTDIVKSVTDWRRLGESVSDSMTLAEQAARLSTGGLMDTGVATEALTSAMKAYGYEVDDVYKIVDQFIYLGNNYAITSEDLATSLEKSSGALVAAGNSLEEAEALEIAGKKCCPVVQKCAA